MISGYPAIKHDVDSSKKVIKGFIEIMNSVPTGKIF